MVRRCSPLSVDGRFWNTNSVRVADVFRHIGRRDQSVVLVGGVRTPSDALVGPVAVAAIRRLKVDVLFLGVHGMTLRAGFTTPRHDGVWTIVPANPDSSGSRLRRIHAWEMNGPGGPRAWSAGSRRTWWRSPPGSRPAGGRPWPPRWSGSGC
ncbi:hypothetical protein E1286_15005 [Nonomuraea terrae]|uniref:DeoR-like transcriptional repressor C-terminal sensor domain-containing protein n=1 Tax=Nonomuraea terrae TaxID=2530383 RepID=A0A4R4YTW3_9ACTN|nr:hypothetical protein E1286_15005 [Nonomuraea terrae]